VRQGREDYYFPLFLVRVLPAGLVGIVLVGVLAPAISALTSSLNSLAATTVEDIYRPFLAREREESHYLRAGRAATLVWAALLTLAAWFLLRGRGIAFSATLALHTCLYGAVLGVFLLGILTRRGNALSTSFGMLAAAATVILLQWRVALDARGRIPEAAAALIERLPVTWNRWVAEHVPLLGWPLWIVAGALVSFVLGFLGSQVIARRGR
jgi:Na+/proline symporter